MAKRGCPKGSHTKYTKVLADEIINELSDGKPLRQICREKDVAWRTIYLWIEQRPDFHARIAKARELGQDAIAEECLDIANNTTLGVVKTYKDGVVVEAREEDMLGHRKLQIETRLKLLAKWNPKRYGDRITHAGDPDAPVTLELKGSDIHG